MNTSPYTQDHEENDGWPAFHNGTSIPGPLYDHEQGPGYPDEEGGHKQKK